MKNFIEQLWYGMHKETPDSPESKFYWEKLFESVEELADPKYNKNDVSDHIYDIAAPYGSAECLRGWKHGIGFALRLAVESLYTPDMTMEEAEEQYKQYGRPISKIRLTEENHD